MQTVLVNIDRCVGCRHCEIACLLEHSGHKDILSYTLEDKDSQPRIRVKTGLDYIPFPNRCRHCHPAPCMQVCPSGAIYREDSTGAVLVDTNKCISCWMCVMICPFSSMDSFEYPKNSKKETALKCDACLERLKQEKAPACVVACKTKALEFGDTAELISEHKQTKSLDIHLAIQGLGKASIPENIQIFKNIKKKLAELGPMPATIDFQD